MLTTVLLATALLIPAAEPSADGTLTVNGNDIAINHVYALYHDDEEGVLLEGPELRILFTDREVDPEVLQEPALFGLQKLARAGKLQGLVVTFDPNEEDRTYHGTVFYTPADPQASMPFFSSSGEDAVFTALQLTDDSVAGSAVDESVDNGFFEDMPKYRFAITFSTPIAKMPPISEKLVGAEAANSAQAKVVLDLEAAIVAGDMETAKKLAPERMIEMEAAMEAYGKDEFLAQIKEMIPDRATRQKQITGVTVRGKRAIVMIQEDNGTMSMNLIKDGDGWRVE